MLKPKTLKQERPDYSSEENKSSKDSNDSEKEHHMKILNKRHSLDLTIGINDWSKPYHPDFGFPTDFKRKRQGWELVADSVLH